MSKGVFYVMLMVLSFAGLAIANYIYNKKRLLQPLVCPVGSNCDNVIHSQYSKLFNIPLEIIGGLYYTIIILSYAIFLAVPSLHSPGAALIILELTAVAFLFSLYLMIIQALVIKEWCTWCLGSAIICTAIFFVEFKFVGFDIVGLIQATFF